MQEKDSLPGQMLEELAELRRLKAERAGLLTELQTARARIVELEGREAHCQAEALHESERRFELLFNEAPLAYQSLDEQGNFLEVNQAWLDALGYSRPEVIGRHFGEFLPDEWRGQFEESFPRFKATGEILGREFELLRKDGTRIFVSFNGRIGYDEQGRIRQTHCIFSDISDRQRAEEARREKEQIYASLFHNNHLPMLLIDPQSGNIVDANPAACAFYGHTQDRILSLSIWDINTLSPQETTRRMSQAVDMTRNRFDFQHRLASGEVRDVEVASGPVLISGNRLLYSLVLDVTARKASERALSESEARYRLLAETMADVVWTMGKNCRFTYVSPSITRLRGLTPEEALQETLAQIMTPESYFRVQALAEIQSRRPLSSDISRIEIEQYRKDGATVWVEVVVKPMLGPDGILAGYLGVSRDITERKKAEEDTQKALAENRRQSERLQAMLNSARGVLEHHDFVEVARLVFNECSKSIGATAGYVALLSPDGQENKVLFLESGGRPCSVDPELPMPIQGLRATAYKLGKTVHDNAFSSSEWMRFMPKGHMRLDNVLFAPLVVHGQTLGIMGLANKPGGFADEDVSLATAFGELAAIALRNSRTLERLSRSEQAQRLAKEAAEVANKAKSQFLATMSHEVRTPLNGIFGLLQLAQGTPLNAEQREYIDTALESGKRLLTILNDILDLSSVEAGRLVMYKERFDLTETVHSVISLFEPQARKKDIRLSAHIAENVPRALRGDEGRLRQVLFNLVGNAVKFTIHGGIRCEVSALPYEQGPKSIRLLFSVSDTGIGIPENKLDYIFEPFTQVDGALQRKRQGTGLGLSITRRLVHLMGGNMSVESEVGVGTSMHFTVKLERCAEPPRAVTTPPSTSSPMLRPLRILLAEDDRINQLAARRTLEKLGHAVTIADNGLAALEAVQKETYDLAILDIQMPELDGVETTRRIRTLDGHLSSLPIIAMTAHTMAGDRESFLAAGMDAYVAKPVKLEDISMAIGEALSKRTR